MSVPRYCRGRSAVLILNVPLDWKPNSKNVIPPVITGVRFYRRRLALWSATAIAESYNLDRLPSRRPDGTWAIVGFASSAQSSVQRAAHAEADAARDARKRGQP